MIHDQRQTILEMVAERTFPGCMRNLHAAHFAGLFGEIRVHILQDSKAKAGDGSQPPVAFDVSLSESAGSRSLDRLVSLLFFHQSEGQRWITLDFSLNISLPGSFAPRKAPENLSECAVFSCHLQI